MRKLVTLLLILLVGGAILSPIIMALELDPMPGDFVLDWNHQHHNIPVLWSLCASGFLALLYSVSRR